MIALTSLLVVYAVALFGCLYMLKNPSKRYNEEARSSESAPDAAKRTLQSIRTIDQKQADESPDVGLLIVESMRAAMDKLNQTETKMNKAVSVDSVEVKIGIEQISIEENNMPLKFTIPITSELTSALQKLVEEHGGPQQFFEQMNTNGVTIMAEFMQKYQRVSQVLYEATTNEIYRRELVESTLNQTDREFVEGFLNGWNKWGTLNPRPFETIKTFIMGSLKDALLGPIPQQVNDGWDCDGIVYLDTFREELYVKTITKLYRPDKELGGPSGWVTSSSVSSYLRTISMMLQTLFLREF